MRTLRNSRRLFAAFITLGVVSPLYKTVLNIKCFATLFVSRYWGNLSRFNKHSYLNGTYHIIVIAKFLLKIYKFRMISPPPPNTFILLSCFFQLYKNKVFGDLIVWLSKWEGGGGFNIKSYSFSLV